MSREGSLQRKIGYRGGKLWLIIRPKTCQFFFCKKKLFFSQFNSRSMSEERWKSSLLLESYCATMYLSSIAACEEKGIDPSWNFPTEVQCWKSSDVSRFTRLISPPNVPISQRIFGFKPSAKVTWQGGSLQDSFFSRDRSRILGLLAAADEKRKSGADRTGEERERFLYF